MTLQLQLSDNTYPTEETGRGGLTSTALPCIWPNKTKELMKLFQSPLLEGCLSLNRINGRCSGTESHPDEKNREQNSAKDDLSCSVLSGVSNSFRFLVEDSSWCKAFGMAEFLTGILCGVWCCSLDTEKPGECGSRGRLWAGRKAAGLHREQGPGHNPALSQR